MSEHHLHRIIEYTSKRKPDLHRIKILMHYHHYHHSLQVKQHPEVKINQKEISLNLNTSLKENQVGHQMLKQIRRQSQNPTMTPKRMRIEPEHIGEKQKGDI